MKEACTDACTLLQWACESRQVSHASWTHFSMGLRFGFDTVKTMYLEQSTCIVNPILSESIKERIMIGQTTIISRRDFGKRVAM